MDATTVAVDRAKDVFQVALANRAGRIIERQRLTRRQFERFLETLTDDREVVMEACGTSPDWGRRLQSRGVHVRVVPVQSVRPYVRRNKTDRATRLQQWAVSIATHRRRHTATVAVANQLARIVWAVGHADIAVEPPPRVA
jgi:transposase